MIRHNDKKYGGKMITTTSINLGSYVEDNIHGYKGRVNAVHLFMELPEHRSWVDMQVPAIEDEAKEPAYLWYSVLCHEGGSVLRPAYALDKIEKFEFFNSWADKYFPGENGLDHED
jgi:hypothetical protein